MVVLSLPILNLDTAHSMFEIVFYIYIHKLKSNRNEVVISEKISRTFVTLNDL